MWENENERKKRRNAKIKQMTHYWYVMVEEKEKEIERVCVYMRKRSSELTDKSAADLKQSRVDHQCVFKDRGRPMSTAFKYQYMGNIMA